MWRGVPRQFNVSHPPDVWPPPLFCRADGVYMYEGSDSPYVSDGKPSYNIIADNYVEDALEGLKMGDTVGNEFYGNVRQTTTIVHVRQIII